MVGGRYQVAVYLRPELYKKVESYVMEKGISYSTAINLILQEYFRKTEISKPVREEPRREEDRKFRFSFDL